MITSKQFGKVSDILSHAVLLRSWLDDTVMCLGNLSIV